MAGTKAAAAAVAQEEREQNLQDEVLNAALQRYELPDNEFDIDKLLGDVKLVRGEEYAKNMELSIARRLQEKLGPHGIIEMTVSTWDLGLKGKFHTAVTVLGYGAALALVAEGIGYVGGWDVIRPTTYLR